MCLQEIWTDRLDDSYIPPNFAWWGMKINQLICVNCTEITCLEDFTTEKIVTSAYKITHRKCTTIQDCVEVDFVFCLFQSDLFYSSLKLVIIDNVASVIYPILGGNQLDGK